MNIPGANILNMAMSVLGNQTFQYKQFAGRNTNAIGLDVASYNALVTVTGSVQPIARNLYSQMGLDLQKNYVNVYVSKNISDIERNISGDQFLFNGRTFQCISKTDWFGMDGWDVILCIEVPNV